jgi:hypothetical protein
MLPENSGHYVQLDDFDKIMKAESVAYKARMELCDKFID